MEMWMPDKTYAYNQLKMYSVSDLLLTLCFHA
ncbi:hypothetical protein BWQ96_02292 [Gracilariopsis chorda]|uniref:Uncharacterized protein n=1 Tax=Gracilariopsis chorda TaxID=448386 RepID=A0A2V3J0G7_9FLOR|nr:hypothetical protein BWQ96_02292 [Gracilariopsis chorda]|eukprot:PXF47906.1 hypothetical protein BWQ96_02292 [Gracilariopsis chorda]